MRARMFAVIAAAFASACGFQPLYAPPAPDAGPGIGQVQIGMIPGRAGHTLRQELDRVLRIGAGDGPQRSLDITLTEEISNLGIRTDESATRADLRLTARYALSGVAGAAPVQGTATTVVSYEIPTAAFGEIAAQDDARERAAETLAQRIRSDLVLRLAASERAS
ncbi:MAG: LPS assembly lipoprotein LptE [Hyphomonadaceae bacterium]|nr:LPS assembly lipoprotein LptE [Hyphomonadaceae bacterium]